MTIYDSLRSLRVRRSGVIGFDEIDISISPEYNTKSYYGKLVASNLRNAFTSRYNYAIIDVNSWTSPTLSCPDNYVEFRFAPAVIDEITVVYSEDISVEEGTPKRLFEIKYIDGTVDTFNFGGTEIDGIKYQTIKPSNKKAVYFRVVFRLDETDEKLIERLKLYHLLITARYEYNAIGYFDSDGNFVPVSSSFPLPISGEITGASGFPYVLGWEDVTTFVEHPDKITIVDEEKAFDKNFFTYAQFTFKPGGEYAIVVRKPVSLSYINVVGSPIGGKKGEVGLADLTYIVCYDDGTKEELTAETVTDLGVIMPVNPEKRCLSFGIKNNTEDNITVNIIEFLLYAVLQVYPADHEKIMLAMPNTKTLKYEDVEISTCGITVSNPENMFDKKIATYSEITVERSYSYLYLQPREPSVVDKVLIRWIKPKRFSEDEIEFSARYIDGTQETLTPLYIGADYIYIELNHTKRLKRFEVCFVATKTYTFYEIWMFVLPRVTGSIALEAKQKDSRKHWDAMPLVTTEVINPIKPDPLLTPKYRDVIGTGDGSTTTFSSTLSHTPVIPKQLSVNYTIGGEVYVANDDGKGNIAGDYISSGTVNYDTGEISIEFSSPPDDGTEIAAGYYSYKNGEGYSVKSSIDGYIHIKITGISSSTVYITPVIDGVKVKSQQRIFTTDTDEIIPVRFFGGVLSFAAYRTGTDYIELTIEEVRR